MKFSFTKWQGCGNDFVLVNGFQEHIQDYVAVTRQICDRHYGIGADGLIMILPSDRADFRMRIFNTDGSEAEMCGNGIRCFARCVYEKGLTKQLEFTVETGAGILTPKLLLQEGKIHQVQVDMGEPVLEADKIPVAGFGSEKVIAQPIEVLGQDYQMTCVSMGNPHCVLFVDDIKKVPIETLGPVFETHQQFPRKINTEFVEVLDRSHLRMRVWERGAAITLACGTGACATLTAAVLNHKTERKAEIILDGGRLTVEWRADGHLYMTGPAEEVFQGIFSDGADEEIQ